MPYKFPYTDNRAPLLPPNQFLSIDKETIITIDDSDEARFLYQRYAGLRENRYKRRCFVTGALYTSIFSDTSDIIHPIPGRTIELAINIGNDVTTTVLITYDTKVDNVYLLALNKLGKSFNEHKDNTRRRNNHDQGKMIVVGEGRKGNGSYGVYSITNSTDDITSATSSVMNLAEDYNNNNGFSEAVQSMNHQCGHSKRIDRNSFVTSIVQSMDLVNSAHVDVNDASESISTWTESNIDNADNWNFILPNTTIDGKKGIVIKLHHGVTIKWDGRLLMHCSTVGSKEKSNHVYGTFFCAKK